MAAAMAPRFCVVGGGLPGLTTAFFLQRKLPQAHITIIERASRCGGELQSTRGTGGRVLEQGFHSSFLVNRQSRETLGLLRLLGLDEDIISANIEASSRRHLLHNGRVQLVPRLQHMLRHGPAIVAEPLWSRGAAEDESVHAFVTRRVSASVADHFADPICRGQFAGDARRLSVRTCFPRVWYNEKSFRSVFMGSAFSMVSAHRRRSWLSLDLFDPLLQRVATGGRSYTLRHGLGTLPAKIVERLTAPPVGTRPAEIITDSEVAILRSRVQASPGTSTPQHAVEIILDSGRIIPADTLVSAIRPAALAEILSSSDLDVPLHATDASLCSSLRNINFSSASVVNVGFDKDVLKGRFRGAGYFSGSLEKEPILAVAPSSQLFPEQDATPGRTLLTVYLDGVAVSATAEEVAVDALRRHLGIVEQPTEIATKHWSDAAPLYEVGHRSLLVALNDARRQRLPWLQVIGPGFFGTRAPADEVVDARELADSLARRFARFPGLVDNEIEEDSDPRYGGGFDVAC
eukprot:TRINITY_DN41555_c0_g2_i1.p1 TRINITY_DN41555_c0_g2~~TRINITY_DN41555_c0_g2_i1.p1  ORF type:complete len:540 (-),score=56.45 TRINITY_DN41555_c0_g2_i1:112-1665(-)